MSIQIQNIHKKFGNFNALNNINLSFEDGSLVALLGPSGCGKTSLLRIIAGLETADQGDIILHGEDVSDTSVRERQVGFVFQHYALFRHMTVFENVAFGLKIRSKKTRPSKADINQKVHELLNLVQLDWLSDRYPAQLSGGQRQRIALARALAVEPKILLLDEPFGALDAKVRKELRRWLRRLHDDLHITSIFVTHDQEEAFEVADQIVLMDKGVVQQVGSPEEIYQHPANDFVYQFLGAINHLPASHLSDDTNNLSQEIYVRPHEVEIANYTSTFGKHQIPAIIERVRKQGHLIKIELKKLNQDKSDPNDMFEVDITDTQASALNLSVGNQVLLNIRKEINPLSSSI